MQRIPMQPKLPTAGPRGSSSSFGQRAKLEVSKNLPSESVLAPRPLKRRMAHNPEFSRPSMPVAVKTPPPQPPTFLQFLQLTSTPPKKATKKPNADGVLLKLDKKKCENSGPVEVVHGSGRCKKFGALVCKSCSSYGRYKSPKNFKSQDFPIYTHQFGFNARSK